MQMNSKFCAATGKSKEQKAVMMATASMGTAAVVGARVEDGWECKSYSPLEDRGVTAEG
jgi:hypothetical protein